jgi:hypothetical protein
MRSNMSFDTDTVNFDVNRQREKRLRPLARRGVACISERDDDPVTCG